VQNLTLNNFTVSANANGQFIGTLAGQNAGMISNVNVTVTAPGTGSVSGSNFQGITAGGLIGQNGMLGGYNTSQAPGTIQNSSASVAVTVGDGCNNCGTGTNAAGGLTGSNVAGSTISNSSASGAVTGGINTALGGLAGINDATSSITSSHAIGAVTDTAAANNGPSCGDSCSFVKAGGLVGQNFGTIGAVPDSATPGALPAPVGTTCGAGFTCASGAVTVGDNGSAGGLTGDNSGVIQFAFATGPVIGGSGVGTGNNINVGGLTGNNKFGALITNTWASGPVSAGSAALAGGLVGADDGNVAYSIATGPVTAAANSIIGGLVGGMSGAGSVLSSSASGAVTATGANTMAGGLLGGSFGLVSLSSATGPVIGTSSSYLGGLIGANGGEITQSFATGPVTGSGTGNYAGGLTGANFAWPLPVSSNSVVANVTALASLDAAATPISTGTIAQSYATGPVSSGANSYVGGLAGASLALSDPSMPTSSATPTITRSYSFGAATGGANSVVAGLVAINTGGISESYAIGAATAGANSVVAGLVAQNAGTLDQTYAVGRVTGGAGSVLGGLVAQNSITTAPSLPAYPSPLQSCDRCGNFVNDVPVVPATTSTVTNSYWDFQTTGQLSSAAGVAQTSAQLTSALPVGFDATTWLINVGATLPYLGAPVPLPTPLPVPGPIIVDSLTPPVTTQAQFVQQLTNPGNLNPPSTGQVVDTTGATQQQQQQGRQGQQSGQQGQQQQGVGGLLPGQIDAGPGRFFFLPVGDQFVFNEGVLTLDSNIPLAQVQQIGAELGFTIVSSQPIGLLGQTAYQFQITNGKPVATIIGELVGYQVVTSTTPQYRFFTTQDAAGEGDPGQYVLEKLKLPEVHRALRGDNVEIAVIDSQIDAMHPDLAGDISSSYDAAGVEEKAHAQAPEWPAPSSHTSA
jgi:hypothetical protein